MNDQHQEPIADEQQRRMAIAERERNVLIDAGAGTGKTTILVRRLLNLIAPEDDTLEALSMRRVAAITFTRRAAGELRLRIRERLLEALAATDLSATRRNRLHDALAAVDTAYVGTIHSFADRMLRLRPIEADLSPSYEIVEDEDELIRETFTQLLHGAETGTLGDMLAGSKARDRAEEAAEIVLSALASGIDADSKELEYATLWGLDGLVAAFIRLRDAPPPDAAAVDLDLDEFGRYARELISLTAQLSGDSVGENTLRKFAACVEEACQEDDAATIYRHVIGREPKKSGFTKRNHFDNDETAWRAWKAFNGDSAKKPVREPPLRDDLLNPLHRWMGTRLVRLFPVVVELYERVKRRHRALDQIDLLVKLRDLLANDLPSRRFYQGLFDHVFVDEFQDTDPLQAQIILYLCERAAQATTWDSVALAPGKLTVVGDPKQSIYRFRRADIAMYEEVRKIIERGPHLSVRLSVNFRSPRSLIRWFNDRFESVLGRAPDDGTLFDSESGQAYHQALDAHRGDDGAPRVHVFPFERPDAATVGPYRALEAEVLSHYLRWLVEVRRFQILDPTTGETRDVRYGDVAVLAIATPALGPLFRALDRAAVPYSARGGTLFLNDPLHKQFILGLRALADRDDGVAQAALYRPPFFAVDLVDLLWERSSAAGDGAEAERARDATELVRDLRRRRFERSPGATARDLLERTAFARSVAIGPNGTQRLARLREICLLLEQEAVTQGLDYDAITAELREWVTHPVQLDPPRPVAASAVQIMTVHQAKGLEFPVVVLWDSLCLISTSEIQAAWRVGRDGRSWVISLQKLNCEEPAGGELAKRERRYADMERRRVVYVAATRARDLLAVPRAMVAKDRHVSGALLPKAPSELVEELPVYVLGSGASWAHDVTPSEDGAARTASLLENEVGARWAEAAQAAAQPRFLPLPVSGAWRRLSEDDETIMPVAKRAGRHGAVFGETVHAAIGRALAGASPNDAVRLAAAQTGLTEQLDEAAADVERTIATLRKEEIIDTLFSRVRLEYPVAAPGEGGTLLIGYADLVALRDRRTIILDFKTDQPPRGAVEETHPEYVAQVRTYVSLLKTAQPGRTSEIRCGLLFTADGEIRWLASDE